MLMIDRQSISFTRRPAYCTVYRRGFVHGTVWQSQLLVSVMFTLVIDRHSAWLHVGV